MPASDLKTKPEMGKSKKSMIGKAVEYKITYHGGKPDKITQGVIRDRYEGKEEASYLVEDARGFVDVVSAWRLTRIIAVVVLLTIGFFSFI